MENIPLTIIIIAHGSRLDIANQEVKSISEWLQERLKCPVIAGFLEIASPSIPEAIEIAFCDKPKEIWIFPYFLTKGKHIQIDIPKIIREKQKDHLGVNIELMDYLGKQPTLIELLEKILKNKLSTSK